MTPDKRAFEADLDKFATAITRWCTSEAQWLQDAEREVLLCRAAVLQAYAAGREGPPWAVPLPKITDEHRETFDNGEPLIAENCWTQTAVDFAAMLQGVRYAHPAPKADAAVGVDETAAKEAFDKWWESTGYGAGFDVEDGWMAAVEYFRLAASPARGGEKS